MEDQGGRRDRWMIKRLRLGLRHEFRLGRLRVRDLPAGPRRASIASLLVLGAIAVVVVLHSIGIGVPGPSFEIPGRFLAGGATGSVALVALLLAGVGIAVACVDLVLANRWRERRLSRLVLVAIGVLGVAMSSVLVGAAGDLARVESMVGETQPVPQPPASLMIALGGAAGLIASVIAIALPIQRRRPINPWILAAAAASPFAITALLLVGVGYETFDLGPSAAEVGLPQILTAAAYVAPSLTLVANIVGFWLVPLVLWQVVTWARASRRELGTAVTARLGGRPWLLVAAVTLKLGWLALGIAGRLPLSIGGGSPVWQATAADGLVAWLIAVAFAALAGWWLVSVRRIPISERGFAPAALMVIVGFSMITVLMSLALTALPIAGLLPGTPVSEPLATACASTWASASIGNTARCLLVSATDHQFELTILVQLATLIAALVVAAWLWRRPGHRSMIVFLLAVVAWIAPRVPDVVGALLGLPQGPSFAPELATLDAALTILIALLAAAWYTGRQQGATPAALLLVLVVSTLLVHAGTLVPAVLVATFFFLALLFPIAYELLFDSETLNEAKPDRPGRVLESLGVRVGTLSLVALGIVVGTVAPSDDNWGELGRVLFAVPFSALLVAATLSHRAEPDGGPEPQPPARPVIRSAPRIAPAIEATPRALGRGIGGALVVLFVLVVGGTAADATLLRTGSTEDPQAPPSPAATPGPTAARPTEPTPLDRLAAFGQRASEAHDDIRVRLFRIEDRLAAQATDLTVESQELRRVAAEERAWLANHPPADCYLPAGNAWIGSLARLDGLATRLAAISPETGTETLAKVIGAADAFNVADLAFIDAFDAATAACRADPAPNPT
ncbi:MAG: hypothetical protein H0T59_09515 [Chloroflexi bacterium]|nr:hypothetical protein [Chloroflexota bacterium]